VPPLARLSLSLLCAGSLLVPVRAGAHAPPLGSRLIRDAADRYSVLVANRGLFFRDHERESWRMLCNEALEINTAEVPGVALLPSGELMVASTAGLRKSADQGCNWSDVDGLGSTSTPAFAQGSTPGTFFVATYDASGARLLVTRDGAQQWSELIALPSNDYVDSLLVATDPSWIYAAGTTFNAGSPPSHFVLRSRDGGSSWTRLELSLQPTDYRARLLAIDPRRPQVVVMTTVTLNPKTEPSRVLLSRDEGQRFEQVYGDLEVASATFGDDGGLWIASQSGLIHSDATLSSFERTSSATNLGCAMEDGDRVLVCGHYAGPETRASGVGVSLDEGRSFTTLFDFDTVREPVSCASETRTAAVCAPLWRDWQVEMFLPVADAGVSDGPASAPSQILDAGAPPAQVPVGDEPDDSPALAGGGAQGCHVAYGRGHVAGWTLAAFLLVARGWRSRRARR
jgi:photosystem II stability/assembly factor-like uncharacterized protein